MKLPLRFATVFAVAVAFAPFLPLYVERTMMHVMFAHGTGTIEWGWKRCTLRNYWAHYNSLRPEQDPAYWLAINLTLAFVYAFIIALLVDRFLARRTRRLLSQ